MDSTRDAAGPGGARAAWRRLAARELAAPGATPDEAAVDALVVGGADGAAIQPIYPDTADQTGAPTSLPGQFPFVRGARPAGTAWVIASRHDDADPARVALQVAEDVARGVEGIVIGVDRAGRLGLDPASDHAREAVGEGGVALVTRIDLGGLLEAADLARVAVWIDAGANALPYVAAALQEMEDRGIDPRTVRLFGGLDVAGAMARDGALPRAVSALADEAAELVGAFRARGLGGRPLAIGSGVVHEAGGTPAQELGFVLAALAELLRALEGRGLPPADVAAALAVEVAIGTDLFAAIAKVRALRLAWSRILVASGVAPDAVPPPFVIGTTSARALSTLDPWTNAVRGTIEAFAAGAAGVDLLVVRPWDEPLGGADRSARRLARNTQLVLRDEAHLADVADPAGGSGWVEAATEALARAAWDELRRIEGEGGLLASLEAGAVGGRVHEARTARAHDLARRKGLRVGVNDFANPAEEVPGRPPRRDPAAVTSAAGRAAAARQPPPTVPDEGRVAVAIALASRGGTFAAVSQVLAVLGPEAPPSCEPLAARRDAARFEALRGRVARLATTAGAGRLALLMPVGPLAAARARLGFAQRLLEVGGYEVAVAAGCVSTEAVSAASAAVGPASVVCLCGPDEAYATLAEPLARAVAGASARPPLVVQAGRPDPTRQASLREAGVSSWFFAGGDAADFLEELVTRLELRSAPEVTR